MELNVCKHFLRRDRCRECNDETTKAARLILAAPDLYEALKDLMERIIYDEDTHDAVDDAKKALAKARGEYDRH